MFLEETITLDCPCCLAAISQSLSWFRKTYSTCPHCGGGLAASQFAAQLNVIEEAFDDAVDEMVRGVPAAGGCCQNKK